MKSKKIIAIALMIATVSCSLFTACKKNNNNEETEFIPKDIVVEKSEFGNPIAGFTDKSPLAYGGDPAALVVGDTVYLYTGHDVSKGNNYDITEWFCYSTKDLVNWKYESVILKASDITWADDHSAWASQMIKYNNKYYFYTCSWSNQAQGHQSIGVAVSDSPTGPFKDKGTMLVSGLTTADSVHSWEDIDPTVWVDTDENGEEHRYLVWGNTRLFSCELNKDMISVKDIDKNGKIEYGTDIICHEAPRNFTEAPWIYRRQNENGEYYGPYYLFYAYGWREEMAYATTDDLMSGKWEFGSVIMEPTATSNTNHMSVFDFKGQTYFIYHNGSLTNGSGYRRVACIEKLYFNADGSVKYIPETATGISGIASKIKDYQGNYISHYHFDNSSDDKNYPYTAIKIGTNIKNAKEEDMMWEIVPGNSGDSEYYISIESYNKPGLFITANPVKGCELTQDHNGLQKRKQTFKTVEGLAGDGGVSFQCIMYPEKYVTVVDGKLMFTDGSDKAASTFYIEKVNN